MALRDWLANSAPVATATTATTATKPIKFHPTVATVATVAVAGHEKSEPIDQEAADLPEGCPLLGGQVPPQCRFEPKFFKRMIHQGVLVVGEPCPLLGVCKLRLRRT